MKVLFLYAHMDDESIMSYGTMMKYLKEGYDVYLCNLCGLGRKNRNDQKQRWKVCNSINRFIKTKSFFINDLELTKKVVDDCLYGVINEVKPDIVTTHSTKDLHFEHRLIGEEMITVCRNIPNSPVKKLMTTVTPMVQWTYGSFGNFNPNVFIDVSEYVFDKTTQLALYGNELQKNKLDLRSKESIMTWYSMWGKVIGVESCEPYELIFEKL